MHKNPANLVSPVKIKTEIAGRVEFIHMSSGWFDCTEPSQSTFLQGKQGLQGAYAIVRGGSSAFTRTFSNHIIVEIARCVERVLSHEFGVVRLCRTFSILMWFEKVLGGSMLLNHPELVHKHPANLVSPVKM